MRQWRLIVNEPINGFYNMAIDEAILASVTRGDQLPTLRLYAWQPFCLSLGYGQRVADADGEALAHHGWDLVRRPTGGKAILHGDELTYSLALPIDHELAQGDVVTSYRRISEALIESLQVLGLVPQSQPQAVGNKGLGAVCFEVPSHYEITVQGRKLIGSAQVRRKEGILQHGTLPLDGDIARICDALYYSDSHERQTAKTQVRERATTLAWCLGKTVDFGTVAQAFMQGFQTTFDLAFTFGSLSEQEIAHANDLVQSTYRHEAWTNKR